MRAVFGPDGPRLAVQSFPSRMKASFPSRIEPLESRIAPAFGAVVDLSILDRTHGFQINGVEAGDAAGYSVSSAGDVNGDGFDDLLIGAYGASPNGQNSSGATYVVFGKRSGFSTAIDLAALDGSNGFQISGELEEDYSGRSVSGAGDVNGDGFDDIIIGAKGADPGGNDSSGVSYVVFGKAGFAPHLDLSTLNGTNGFKIIGEAAHDYSGSSVSRAGDVNGDGFDDLLIGAPGANGKSGTSAGATYVIFGKAHEFAAAFDLSGLNGANGFKIVGNAAYDYSGSAVSAAGDVNGDGIDDLLIGAYGVDSNGNSSGTTYVVFGKKGGFPVTLNARALNGNNGFAIIGETSGDSAGASVRGAGDVNGDGFDDLLIGAYGADDNGNYSGAAYVVFGKAAGFAGALDLSTLNGSNGFKIVGETAGDVAGISVSGAGDVNGDGFDDLLIGAYGAQPNGPSSGSAYVVFGKAAPFSNILNLSTLDGFNGFKINGAAAGDNFGISVSRAGDVNHDGFDDLLIGASGAPHGDSIGAAYVILGRDSKAFISTSDASIVEGDFGTSALAFDITLDATSSLPVTVNFATLDGTAAAGSDYLAPLPGTLIFAPGETVKTVVVEIIGDSAIETHENFTLLLSGAINATIAKQIGVGAILNDDTALRIGDAAQPEGNSGVGDLTFTVSLDQPSALPVTVSVGSEDGTAIAGSDYVALSSDTLTFAPGETSHTIAVHINGDTANEPDEIFTVLLSNPANAVLADATAIGTIQNDDTLLQINDASIREGHAGTQTMVFTVSLTAPHTEPVTVNFMTEDRTATAGSDYLAPTPGTLTFLPGETAHTITVAVSGDLIAEGNETFAVILSGASNAGLGDAVGLGTILNDDVSLVGNHKAVFTDVDGDLVTIGVSKGVLSAADFVLVPSGLGSQLALVDFSSNLAFAGANLKITAARTTGDGHVNVGYINARGIDLGRVAINGDLGQIDTGDPAMGGAGLASLSARSIGHFGLATQLPDGSANSDIDGDLEKLKLADGMTDATLLTTGDIDVIKIKGTLFRSVIRSGGVVGTLKIGNLLGTGDDTATISARGNLSPITNSAALAFGRIAIHGFVEDAQILAGYDLFGAAINGEARIGAVTVGRDWIGSDLVAGAQAGEDGQFGTGDDALISPGNPIISRIASIVIKGAAKGSDNIGDHFGLVAEEIGVAKVSGIKVQLMPGPGNDIVGHAIGQTGNLRVREVV